MYGENRAQDVIRLVKAYLTNILASVAPRFYVRLTGQTGRGGEEESPSDVADYFRQCFDDYFDKLGVPSAGVETFLAGKSILEYGPGDIPGVAFLMYAYGASHIICVDRFPLVAWSEKNLAVIEDLLNNLPELRRQRLGECFNVPGRAESGLKSGTVDYRITDSGLSNAVAEVDLVLSRAVLEHVNDLPATFTDMYQALRPGGIAVHQVDLKSHGLHRRNELDFLTWPVQLWDIMYSHKGVQNRWRIDKYREIIADTQFEIRLLVPTARAENTTIDEVRPYLAAPFKRLSDEDLAWLGFWLVLQKPCEQQSGIDSNA